MSVDSYYCFCCLSTDDLKSLYDCSAEKSYAKMLEYMFSFKPMPEDNENDTYICMECIIRLDDAHKFKTRVYETLNILQKQGLIELHKIGGELLITRGYSSLPPVKEKDETTGFIGETEVKLVKNEDDQSETLKSKCAITSIITQPMVKVTVGETSRASIHNVGVDSQLSRDLDTEHTIQDNGQSGNQVKKEPERERDANINVKSEQDSDTVRRTVKSDVSEDFTCKICAKKLPNLYVYHTHMNNHMPHHICETCGKGFPNPTKLRRHKYSHQTGPFVCVSCGAQFTNYNTYCGHRQRNHAAKGQYGCPHCADRFRTFARRARHLHAAHGINNVHKCEECGKGFLVASSLTNHIRCSHRKVKRHPCTLCDAAFFFKQDFVAHVSSVHTGELAFQCHMCRKRFPRKNALKVHLRTHADEKPFSCALCDKQFTQKCALVAHIKVHTRERKDLRKTPR